jgi:hypothetical protein
VQKALPERAIDVAFIDHVGKLFETFCADIKMARSSKSTIDHARKQFAEAFQLAVTTHTEMINHLSQCPL